MHPSRNTGIGGLTAGLAVIAAVLVGDVTATTSNYWYRPPVIAALGIGALLSVLGLWTLGATYRGWWQPQTHEERMTARANREADALVAHYARRDALQELIDELENNARDLKIQLDNGRTFGLFHPGNAWAKNRHVLNGDELAETRDLVQDAYLQTHALNQRTKERYDAASHDDVNDPEWLKLNKEEVQERTEALEAVTKARAAVISVKDSGGILNGLRRERNGACSGKCHDAGDCDGRGLEGGAAAATCRRGRTPRAGSGSPPGTTTSTTSPPSRPGARP